MPISKATIALTERMDRRAKEFEAAFPPFGCADREHCGWTGIPTSVGSLPECCPACGGAIILNPGASMPDRRIQEHRDVRKHKNAESRKGKEK